jgi:hypothetical protein
VNKKHIIYITAIGLAGLLINACNTSGGSSNNTTDSPATAAAIPVTDSAAATAAYPTLQAFWTSFQQAVKENDKHQLVNLTHLPLQGITPFVSTPEKVNSVNADTALFLAALPDLLGKVPRTQILETSADSLLTMGPDEFSEQISGSQALLPIIDKDSKIYLSYAQWATDESKETNQALIFAKINGSYKLCAAAWRGSIAN